MPSSIRYVVMIYANFSVSVPTTLIGVLFVMTVPLDCVHLVEFKRRIRTVPLGLLRATTGVKSVAVRPLYFPPDPDALL